MKEKVEQIVFSIISSNTEDLNIGIINSDTLLLSEGSDIDSMTIVSIVVDLESKLSDVFQKEISLSDEKAMTREKSPFKNIKNLIEYILELLN
jgi:acyl carrier protein